MSSVRKIAFATTTRAEYGLLLPIYRELSQNPAFDPYFIVSGTHLSPTHGGTLKFIRDDGVKVLAEIPITTRSDSALDVSRAASEALLKFAELFTTSRPELLFLLGDRTEILPIAEAAAHAAIPVAHVHGGEITEGAVDDWIRHAVTKLSHLHFTASEVFSRRVCQLGEESGRVHTVGAPGLDGLRSFTPKTREAFAADFGLQAKESFVLVAFHPETLGKLSANEAFDRVLAALKPLLPKVQVLFSYPNQDLGGQKIIDAIRVFEKENPGRVFARASFGQENWWNALWHSLALVGNSSSGIIEAPFLGRRTLNIGDRQKGRPCATSIVNVPCESAEIEGQLLAILKEGSMPAKIAASTLYGDGQSARRIHETLKTINWSKLLQKKFHDLGDLA